MLKIGLVGVGYLGSRHLKHLIDLDGVEVAAVWDIDPAACKAASDAFNVPVADDLDDLMRRCDAVDIVTPTVTHAVIADRVIRARLPVFIEKPLCASVEDGERIVQLAEELAVPIQVGHIERFNRACRALANFSVKPRFIEAHRLAPWNPRGIDVAVVYDLMIHDLDLILWLAPGEPIHVHANGVPVVTSAVDIATARIEFSGGLVANVTASRISLKRMRKLRMFGENEYVALDLMKGTCEYVGAVDQELLIPDGAEPLGTMSDGSRRRILYQKFLNAPEGDALILELGSFRDALLSGSPPPVTGRDGLNALKLAHQVIEAIRRQ